MKILLLLYIYYYYYYINSQVLVDLVVYQIVVEEVDLQLKEEV